MPPYLASMKASKTPYLTFSKCSHRYFPAKLRGEQHALGFLTARHMVQARQQLSKCGTFIEGYSLWDCSTCKTATSNCLLSGEATTEWGMTRLFHPKLHSTKGRPGQAVNWCSISCVFAPGLHLDVTFTQLNPYKWPCTKYQSAILKVVTGQRLTWHTAQ